MKTIKPSNEQISAFVSDQHDGKPTVMLNMLKFRDKAAYPADYLAENPEHANRTGEQAYEAYSKKTMPFLMAVRGRPLWVGKVTTALIGPVDETWDRVFLVYYPSRDAMKKMISNPAYRAISFHRDAALEDSRLVETKDIPLPKILLRVMGLVFWMKQLFSRG